MSNDIDCIANNGDNGEAEVPLWECPCAPCTRLDWEALDGCEVRGTLGEHRRENFPAVWA